MFVNNPGRFFQRLNNEEENHQCEIPNFVEAQTFWRVIWGKRKQHYKDAERLKDVEKELEQDEGQDKIDITKESNAESNEKDAKLESSWSKIPKVIG